MFSFGKIWKYLWPEMRKYKTALVLLTIGYTIGVFFDRVVKPYVFKEIIDSMIAGNQGEAALSNIYPMVFAFALSIIFYNSGYRLGDYANSYFQSNVMRELYNTTFHKLIQHSYSFFSNNFSGSLVAKAKRLPRGFERFFDVLAYQTLFAIVSLTGILIVLFLNVPVLGFLFLIWTVIYFWITVVFVKKKIKLDMAAAAADSAVTGHLADAITNILNIKIFSKSKKEKDKFSFYIKDEEQKRRKEWYFGNLQNLLQAFMMGLLQVVVLVIALKFWSEGKLSVGTIVLLQAYMLGLFDILWDMARAFTKAMQSLSEMVEVIDIFEQTPDILDRPNPEKTKIKDGQIKFDNVSFEYIENHEVFSGFTLDIVPGEKVGLVGHSGSGKSTITKLLLRFADVKSGSINIDGQNIVNITQDDLRNAISYVPQEPILFHRTIRENIAYALPEARDEEVEEAAKKAHAHEFVSGLQKGYDTLVGERGVKLSGGERQRVAIARAMLKRAPILVLDEATSSLDSISESYIQDAFNELMKGKTTIVIAHRLSTIQKMDRIVVLDKGKIVEEGTHKELLKNNGVYKSLWDHQTGGFLE